MNFLVSVMDVDVPHTVIAAHNSCMQSKPTKMKTFGLCWVHKVCAGDEKQMH